MASGSPAGAAASALSRGGRGAFRHHGGGSGLGWWLFRLQGGWGSNHGNAVTETPTFQITASIEGVAHTFPCRADQTVLAAAEAAGVPLPSSCCSGVCTTCAALIRSGTVDQPDAMGVKAELQQQGYALLCVSYPLSDLTLLAGQEDALYEAQFGQYQK
jgi:ferredoxin